MSVTHEPPTPPDTPASIEGASAPLATIAAVARDTGIGKDTLRAWERRYGFPMPERDERGERHYPAQQLARLRLIRRLLDLGHRPRKIVALAQAELLALQPGRDDRRAGKDDSTQDTLLRDCLALITQCDGDALAAVLSGELLRMGLAGFVTRVVAPLTTEVGLAWSRGEIRVFEEHLYTEVAHRVLRSALGIAPANTKSPTRARVLLGTFPQESHGLGLLMAEAMFTLAGCRCQSLGVQIPVADIAAAVRAHRADIVALSFSASMNPNQVRDGLAELRGSIPSEAEIWAGGANAALRRRAAQHALVVSDLDEVAPAIEAWRERAAS